MKLPRSRRCKAAGCREWFKPMNPAHIACGKPECALAIVEAKREKAKAQAERQAKKAKAERKRLNRTQLEAMKTLPQLLKEAQHEFNRYIRARDAGLACVCCGVAFSAVGIGGSADAGHYRSVGSAPHLRFHEDNVHAQRKRCNRFGAGRAVDYRVGLIARIGLARVEALEANNTPLKLTRDQAREIRNTYRARANEMEKAKGIKPAAPNYGPFEAEEPEEEFAK